MYRLGKFSIFIAIICIALFLTSHVTSQSKILFTVKDFTTCEQSGYPVMESYPRQCRTPEGTMYVEEIKITVQPIEVSSTSVVTQTSVIIPTSSSATSLQNTIEKRNNE